LYPLQLQPGLHWADQMKAENELKKHWDACEKGMTEKLAMAEHAPHHQLGEDIGAGQYINHLLAILISLTLYFLVWNSLPSSVR